MIQFNPEPYNTDNVNDFTGMVIMIHHDIATLAMSSYADICAEVGIFSAKHETIGNLLNTAKYHTKAILDIAPLASPDVLNQAISNYYAICKHQGVIADCWLDICRLCFLSTKPLFATITEEIKLNTKNTAPDFYNSIVQWSKYHLMDVSDVR